MATQVQRHLRLSSLRLPQVVPTPYLRLPRFGRNILAPQWNSEMSGPFDHQLELDWGLDGKLAWLRALEDAVDIAGRAPKLIAGIRPIGDWTAVDGENAGRVNRRQAVPSGKRNDQRAMR